MIRAVLFDLGNTLVSYYTRAEFPAVLRSCLQSALHAAAIGELTDAVFDHAVQLNRESPDHSVRLLKDRLNELVPGFAEAAPNWQERIALAFIEPIFARAQLDSSAVPVLRALRRLGLRTAIVSNTPWGSPASYWRAELNRHGLLQLVDTAIFCIDTGWRKPHPEPVLRALRDLQIEPDDAIFVGDDPVWDIEGARRAGVRPVLLTAQPPGSTDYLTIPSLQDLLYVVQVEGASESGLPSNGGVKLTRSLSCRAAP